MIPLIRLPPTWVVCSPATNVPRLPPTFAVEFFSMTSTRSPRIRMNSSCFTSSVWFFSTSSSRLRCAWMKICSVPAASWKLSSLFPLPPGELCVRQPLRVLSAGNMNGGGCVPLYKLPRIMGLSVSPPSKTTTTSIPREGIDRTRIQVFNLAGKSSIGAASLPQTQPWGGARSPSARATSRGRRCVARTMCARFGGSLS